MPTLTEAIETGERAYQSLKDENAKASPDTRAVESAIEALEAASDAICAESQRLCELDSQAGRPRAPLAVENKAAFFQAAAEEARHRFMAA